MAPPTFQHVFGLIKFSLPFIPYNAIKRRVKERKKGKYLEITWCSATEPECTEQSKQLSLIHCWQFSQIKYGIVDGEGKEKRHV